MKKILILVALCLNFFNGYAQEDADTQKLLKIIEQWCPIYVLDNYCSQTGLTDIYKQFKLDDRFLGSSQVELMGPMTRVLYNNSIILFEDWENTEHLHNFIIYFRNESDMNTFAKSYAALMGFVPDNDNPSRFYYENASMNAITQNSSPEKNSFFSTCFVYQPGYCWE